MKKKEAPAARALAKKQIQIIKKRFLQQNKFYEEKKVPAARALAKKQTKL